jgi:hypothetical protein
MVVEYWSVDRPHHSIIPVLQHSNVSLTSRLDESRTIIEMIVDLWREYF